MSGLYSEKTGKTYDAEVILDDTGGKYVNFKLEFPAAGKAVPRKGRRYGRERIEPLGADCDPKAGYGTLRQL